MILNVNRIVVFLGEDQRWYNFYDYSEITEKGKIDYSIKDGQIGAFIKGGSIIPLKMRFRRSSKLMRKEPITLIVALNNENSANGIIYMDDEESFDFETV